MAEPFLAEVKVFPFGMVPAGWAQCGGQLLPINQNQALFSLLGTTFGGDGRVSFGLPNLQGDVPMHAGNGHPLGEKAGEGRHVLSVDEMPPHAHPVNASEADATATAPGMPAAAAQAYGPANGQVGLDPASVGPTGGDQPHENMMPYLALNFCIAIRGLYPSRN